jgi:hypothetical protein
MAEVNKPIMAQAIRELREAPHRLKGRVLGEWLRVLGISRNAFYREAQEWGEMKDRKVRRDKGERKLALPALKEQVQILCQLKHRPPPGVRLSSTETALIYGVENGLVSPELAAVPVGSLNRMAREWGWQATEERQTRWQAAYANQVHQFDSSHSEHFFPLRPDGDDWILRLRPRRMKNKEKVEGLAVIAYGLCDDHSGLRLSQYTVAAGESALGSIEFLKWAWSYAPEHAPFEGWPDELYVDNGPLARHKAFDEFAGRLGLKVTAHLPYKSRCTGKVENVWRTQWRKFENVFFFNPAWESFEIKLSELNRECAAFWKKHNQLPHRSLSCSREAAWHQSILARGGVTRVEPGAWNTIFVEAERQLDAAGCFDFRGAAYQVDEIWACQIKVFVSLKSPGLRTAGGDACATVIVQDQRDGKRYRARPLVLREWGEFRGAPKSELEILKAADEGKVSRVPAPPSWIKAADNVVVLPPRAAEVRESGFQMPAGGGAGATDKEHRLETCATGESLEEMAAGVRVIQRSTGETPEATSDMEEPLAPTLEQYTDLRIKVARGQRLSPREAAFITWYEGAHVAMMQQFGADVDMRVRLAVVE